MEEIASLSGVVTEKEVSIFLSQISFLNAAFKQELMKVRL